MENEANSTARFSKGGQEKSRKSEKGPNEWLAEKFDQLHDLYEGQVGKNPHSIRQYRNGEPTEFLVGQSTNTRCSQAAAAMRREKHTHLKSFIVAYSL